MKGILLRLLLAAAPAALSFAVSAESPVIDIRAYPGAIPAEALAASEAVVFTAPDSRGFGESVAIRRMPIAMTAEDFITRVYGVFSPDRSGDDLRRDCKALLNLMPEEDNMGLWLQSGDGYRLSYYGMMIPDCTAMATLERDSIADFGFFFLFPYRSATRVEMNGRQAAFCGSLLQEMQDMGMVMAAAPDPEEALFEAAGEYKGNYVDIRLFDEEDLDGSGNGRYVLYLTVNLLAKRDKSPSGSLEPG